MDQPKISIIIVNWNGKHLLEECLISVEKQGYDNFNTILVDNGSIDGSVEFIKEKFSKVDVIGLKENTGFAKANNIGMHKAFEDEEVEYIVPLNNDAILEEGCLFEMVKVAVQSDDKIGSVAPKILKYYKRNEIDRMGILIHRDGGGADNHTGKVDSGQFDNDKEVFGPSGCVALYSKKMLKDVQIDDDFFDDDFFAYFEDIDLNWRARLRGWKSLLASNAVVYHKGSETAGKRSYFQIYYSNRNKLFVMVKNLPMIHIIIGILSCLFYYCRIFFGFTAKTLVKKDKVAGQITSKEIFIAIFKSWIYFLIYLPKMIKKRFYIQKRKTIKNKEIFELFKKFEERKNKIM